MLQFAVVWRIRERLRKGESLRRIARELDVNQHTVAAVAARLAAADADPEVDEDSRPFVRCPECGMRVRMPCYICQVHALAAASRAGTFLSAAEGGAPPPMPFAPQDVPPGHDLDSPAEDDLDVELDDEFRQRYEEVRELRLLEEEENAPAKLAEPALPWLLDEEYEDDEFHRCG